MGRKKEMKEEERTDGRMEEPKNGWKSERRKRVTLVKDKKEGRKRGKV